MTTLRNPRLSPLFQRQDLRPAPTGSGAAHDMLVLSSRPDLIPEFPPGLAHPSQREPLSRPLVRPGEGR